MALSAHLQELNNKHEQLDVKLQEELKHPAPDTIRVADLKKRKYQIKQKITQYAAH